MNRFHRVSMGLLHAFVVEGVVLIAGCGREEGPQAVPPEPGKAVQTAVEIEKEISLPTRPAELAGIVREDASREARLAALARIEAEPLLAELVEDGADVEARRIAWSKIQDPVLLARLEPWVNAEAAMAVEDPALISKLATRAWLAPIRKIAVERCEDAEALSAVATADPSGVIRKMAVNKIADTNLLARIAREDQAPWYVRQAALEKIDDPGVLAVAAQRDGDGAVARAALARLTDEAAILDAALNSGLASVRRQAVDALNQQGMLARFVRETRDGALQRIAFGRLTDERLKQEVAPWLEPKAAGEVSDQNLLAQLAESGLSDAVRAAAVERLENPGLLARIATSDSGEIVREAAVGKIADQAVLRQIATEGPADIRAAAVAKLEDPALLEALAVSTNESYDVRSAALSAMQDDGALMRMAGSEALDPSLRSIAVQKIRDEEFLARMVRAEPLETLRDGAFRSVTNETLRTELKPWATASETRRMGEDKALMARIAAEAADDDVRQAAAEMLDDQPLLFSIACSARFSAQARKAAVIAIRDPASLDFLAGATNFPAEVREAALAKSTNAILMASIAQSPDTDYLAIQVRASAIRKLEDQALLERIGTSTNEPAAIRLEAVKRLKTQDALVGIALADPDEKVRSAAQAGVTNAVLLAELSPWFSSAAAAATTDPSLLRRLARESKVAAVRKAAILRVADPAVVAEGAESDADATVRQAALALVSDPDALARIASKDADAETRRLAVERLSDQTVLESIAREDAASTVRQAAVARLENQAALAELARHEPDAGVRLAAERRVVEPALRLDVDLWTKPDEVRKEESPFLLARMAATAGAGDVRKAAIEQLTQSSNQVALVAYEWLAHRLIQEGKQDDAILATLLATLQYLQDPQKPIALCQELHSRTLDLHGSAVLQAGLKSLAGESENAGRISLDDVSSAVRKMSGRGLDCESAQLVEDAVGAFRKALAIKPGAAKPEPDRFLGGDIAYVAALGLAMLQREEDWPFIERYLASDAYHPVFSPHIRAMAERNPEFDKKLLSHPSPMIRAAALIALEKPAPAVEGDSLVRCAGAWHPEGGLTNEAARVLEAALDDARHVVRVMALRGLSRLGRAAPLEKIKQAMTTSQEWRDRYTRGSFEIPIDGAMYYFVTDGPSSDAIDCALLQSGFVAMSLCDDLDAASFTGCVERISGLGREYPGFSLSTNTVEHGYRIERAETVSSDKMNADIADLLERHAPRHAAAMTLAVKEAEPYRRMVLLQAVGPIATNATMRELLWRIAEEKEDGEAYENRLYEEKVSEVSKNLGWNQTVNYSGISDWAARVAGSILGQSRCLAVNHLAATAEDPAELERLAALLGDGQTARAALLVLLNRDSAFIERHAPDALLKDESPDVRLCTALVRLVAADSADVRTVLADVLKGEPDRVALAARVGLQTKSPAIIETVLKAEGIDPVSVAGHLIRRLMFL